MNCQGLHFAKKRVPHLPRLTFRRVDGDHNVAQGVVLLHFESDHIGGAIVPEPSAVVFPDLAVRDEKKVRFLTLVNSQCDGDFLEGASQPL